jgi:hypothetical protein
VLRVPYASMATAGARRAAGPSPEV